MHEGVFKQFENDDGQFVCYARQSNQSVTAMYNLFRAANQTTFPDDDVHLIGRIPSCQVGYGLDFPWEASMPRIETRMYLEQYGGSADVGIGKVLYRYTLLFRKVGKSFMAKFIRRRKNKGVPASFSSGNWNKKKT